MFDGIDKLLEAFPRLAAGCAVAVAVGSILATVLGLWAMGILR